MRKYFSKHKTTGVTTHRGIEITKLLICLASKTLLIKILFFKK